MLDTSDQERRRTLCYKVDHVHTGTHNVVGGRYFPQCGHASKLGCKNSSWYFNFKVS